jgi:chorismate dehydratase
LLRVLLKHYWQKRPILIEADEQYISSIKHKKAGVIIGDRALEQLPNFPYVYDLAKAWQDYTQLPFVFATWVTNQKLPDSFIESFNKANELGFDHLNEIIAANPFPFYDLKKYYTENIFYSFDEEMKKGMTMFLKLAEQL